jgi:hypothetical protein
MSKDTLKAMGVERVPPQLENSFVLLANADKKFRQKIAKFHDAIFPDLIFEAMYSSRAKNTLVCFRLNEFKLIT